MHALNPVTTPTTPRRDHGFGMLEVLVAVLVLSVGLLGLAGLQASSVRNTHSAYLRSQASILAYDMLDRMRANAAAIESGAYTVGLGGTGNGGLATRDLTLWQNTIDRTLPNGDGQIGLAANNQVTITVQWDDQFEQRDGAGNVSQTSQFQFTTQLSDE